jgi:hypothetical protein
MIEFFQKLKEEVDKELEVPTPVVQRMRTSLCLYSFSYFRVLFLYAIHPNMVESDSHEVDVHR